MFRWSWLRGEDKPGEGELSSSERAKVARIMDMGFEESPAVFALRNSEGDVDAAVAMLLSGAETAPSHTSASGTRREQAARAAEARQSSTSRSSSSSGKKRASVSKPMSFEKKLEQACARLADQPPAVDMLIFVIGAILEHPGEKKYRELKMTNTRFRDTIGAAGRSGTAMLELVGFKQAGDWFVLRGNEDSAKLWLAKSALGVIVTSSAIYRVAKDRIAFEAAMKESLNSADREESRRREQYKSGVPVEPEVGRAGTTRITAFVGPNVLQRRFNSDDVLDNVLSWLGATHSSLIPERLSDGSWELVDKTLFPSRVIDIAKDRKKTLQAARMWPGAELVVQTAGTHGHEQKEPVI